jgi:DNA-binding transcriptional LysR family regulator
MLAVLRMPESMPKGFDAVSLDGLGVLRAVVEAGSFVRAGEALGLTQPAVSRAVARLEERVGVTIFRRTARSISLTDEGRDFYESIAPHLNAIEEATGTARDARALVRGRLRVNVDPGTAEFLLTPRLPAFLARYSGLFVELAVRDRMGELVREGFDAAVRFGNPEPSALKARLLLRARVVTCASPEYIKQHGAPARPEDVEKHTCVLMRNPTTGSYYAWEFVRGRRTVQVNVSGQLMVNQVGPMLSACLAGQGVTQLLDLYARPFFEDGRLVQLLPEWSDETYPLYAYHHSEQLLSAKVRAFLEFATAAVREKVSAGTLGTR